jgi:hypothetical protein
LIFTAGGGPAGGTSYLIATTNATFPMNTWARVATNRFDLTGNFTMTNPIPTGIPQRWHRLALP